MRWRFLFKKLERKIEFAPAFDMSGKDSVDGKLNWTDSERKQINDAVSDICRVIRKHNLSKEQTLQALENTEFALGYYDKEI